MMDSVVLLTVLVPIGVTGLIAVYDGVLGVVRFPCTVRPSDHHPAVIITTATICTVDEEAASVLWVNIKYVPRLGREVIPGESGLVQFVELEPVQLV